MSLSIDDVCNLVENVTGKPKTEIDAKKYWPVLKSDDDRILHYANKHDNRTTQRWPCYPMTLKPSKVEEYKKMFSDS
jgi:hypothetical protein